MLYYQHIATIALDTNRAVKRLRAHGFTNEQAEGIVETLADSEFVTKGDMREAISELKADIFKAMMVQTGAIVAILATLFAVFG